MCAPRLGNCSMVELETEGMSTSGLVDGGWGVVCCVSVRLCCHFVVLLKSQLIRSAPGYQHQHTLQHRQLEMYTTYLQLSTATSTAATPSALFTPLSTANSAFIATTTATPQSICLLTLSWLLSSISSSRRIRDSAAVQHRESAT